MAGRVRAPVTAEEIAGREGVITAQDLVRLLRPGAIGSRVYECTKVELKVFIDGARVDWPVDTLIITRAPREKRDNLLKDLPLFLHPLVVEIRKSRPTQKNMYAAWLALGKLWAHEIERADFLDCMDVTVPIAHRNSIWIVTKRATGGEDGW